MGCLIDAALELNIVERKGSWYSFHDRNFAQGKFNASQVLKQDEAMAGEIAAAVKAALSGNTEAVSSLIKTESSAEEEEMEILSELE